MLLKTINKPLSIILIFFLGILIYSNTFHCSFQFDDKTFIVENPAIRNIADLQIIWNYMPCRFFTFLTIALNYHFHQLNVFDYHLLNLCIHLTSACLVWWLVLLTFLTPAMKEQRISINANVIALFAGLIFVSHPLQTQAVTYIWQRSASMATLFYLASLCFYIKSRLESRKIYYIFSLIMAVMAMFTKENTITLPLMILLYEYSFLKTKKYIDWEYLSPFLITLSIIPLTMLFSAPVNKISNISSMHYFLTQIRVMITYIRLELFPFNQNVDYDYPVFKNISETPVFISLFFISTILFWGKCLFSKYRILSFSIFWFFLSLLPESSILPLQDVIFEHRLYLPMVGFSIFLASGLFYLLDERKFKAIIKILVLIITCYSVLTYQRNKIWENEFTLWNDAVKKSPHKARPLNNRGLACVQEGKFAMALSDYNEAIQINPQYINAYINRGFLYDKEGNFIHALSDYNTAIKLNPLLAGAYINRGNVYEELGQSTQSLADFNKAISLNPKIAEAYNDLGNIYFKRGNFTQAITEYTHAIELKSDYADAYYNLGFIYYRQGNLAQAVVNYNKDLKINPHDSGAYNNLSLIEEQLKENKKE